MITTNMKRTLLVMMLLFGAQFAYSQGDGVMPLAGNPDLYGKYKPNKRANPGTFDSTFIYTTDTIDFPVIDDFSKNRIQVYDADYSDPGVTFDKKYRLTDLAEVPLPANALYTSQLTFRRVYNTNTGITSDENFTPLSVRVGDLSEYPVVYTTTNAYPPYYIFDTLGIPDVSDTVWIVGPNIYQDSATQFFAQAANPEAFWMDDHAYHNYRFAVDPWSLGVMTFDGLDRTGYPYQMGTTISNYGDYLTSKPIDMTSVSLSDSVYLTFLVQREGFGDETEEQDSLVLEFYDSQNQQWIWQWSVNGGPLGEFMLAHIPVTNAVFFTDAFQFRFKNFGGLSGSLDHFHLDYVKLRGSSGYQDTLIEDFAMVYPVPTLLKDYTAVPWDHYRNNPTGKMSPNVEVVVRNSYLNGGANISSAAGGNIEIFDGGVSVGNIFLNGQTLANFSTTGQPDYMPRTTYHSFHDATSFQYDNTSTATQRFFEFETVVSVPVGSNFLPNDTVRNVQAFRNYYAHDDGTAEQAYGPQGNQARLAVRFTPYEADSIIGAMIHFVPTVTDVSNKLFQLVIWDDNGGQPGTVLYEDNAFFARQPQYGNERNEFIKYFTEDTLKVPVSGTFYIGWKQIDPQRLGIGLDRNIDTKQHTLFSLDGGATWEQTPYPGSVMIRPIFSTSLDPELGIKEKVALEQELLIYPNPTTGIIHVETRSGELGEIQVYSIRGELILSTTENTVDLSGQPAGMYFVRSSVNPARTYKVMKGQ